MQDEKRYIVAVDLGSSHITGAVGHRGDDGRFTVDAVEIGESKDGIKRGRVINVSDVALKLSQIFRRLEARISPSKISKVYVGVSGQSIRSIEFPVVRTISSESPIDDSLFAELEAEARDRILENNLVVFDVIPGECRVDGRATEKPCGQYGSEIRVSYRLIVGNEIHKRNIDRVFEQAKMPIAGYICTANAAAVAVLSEEERRQGCALLDCGAETTTLSLYKDGYFASMITIPLGGNNITRDICSLHVKESEAESIKKAYQPQIDGTITVDWGMKDYYFDFTAEKIEEVIMARLGEIIANVKAQLLGSGYMRSLTSGITLIGGGASMKGLKTLLAKETDLDVCRGTLLGVSLVPGINGVASVQVIGLLLTGKEICAAPPVVEKKEEIPAPEKEPQLPPQPEPPTSGTKSSKSPIWKTIWDTMKEEMDKEN